MVTVPLLVICLFVIIVCLFVVYSGFILLNYRNFFQVRVVVLAFTDCFCLFVCFSLLGMFTVWNMWSQVQLTIVIN